MWIEYQGSKTVVDVDRASGIEDRGRCGSSIRDQRSWIEHQGLKTVVDVDRASGIKDRGRCGSSIRDQRPW